MEIKMDMSIFERLNFRRSAGRPEYLIVGLGNPGDKYKNTRHNAGFLALDQIAEENHIGVSRLKFKSLTGDGTVGGKHCLLMKPQTFMNNSGEAVSEAVRFYKIPMEHVLVIYDDISLEPGKMRIRRKGSHGGHNGIRDIIELTGTEEFPRIKIGVGKKPRPDYDLAAWVLSQFTETDKKALTGVFHQSAAAAALIAGGKIDEAINCYNS